MNKEDYAQMHYLLAKLKYLLAKDLMRITNKKLKNQIRGTINNIDNICKIVIIEKD